MLRSKLPSAFIEYMTQMLGSGESEAFLSSYEASRTQGLRLNPYKAAHGSPVHAELERRFGLEPVAWCPTGYTYKEEIRPGKHPYHAAGLYYIQEPSAMSAVELLAPGPGDTVLDLAAAPGGKSTQIAGKIGPLGLLVANEIHPARALILSENLERMGAANAVAVNATPDRLADRFPAFFDKIMLDAPCSGEGMFRKDPEAIAEWSPGHVAMCASRQMDIMRQAVRMLRPGGRLGYSTCTFNREENELLLAAVVSEFPELRVERTERIWPHLHRGEGHFVAVLQMAEDADLRGEGTGESVSCSVAAKSGQGSGRAGNAPMPGQHMSRRKQQATGRSKQPPKPVQEAMKRFADFAAEVFREQGQPADKLPKVDAGRSPSVPSQPARHPEHFMSAPAQSARHPEHSRSAPAQSGPRPANLPAEYAGLVWLLPDGEPILFGEQLYWLPHGPSGRFSAELLNGIKTLRPGLHLATLKKNRVEPAHALALAAPAGSFRGTADFAADSPELAAYLRGEALAAPEGLPAGWLPVCADGFPVGWAKNSGGQLKNHYPKGLRQP